jgi:hypothetical protein
MKNLPDFSIMEQETGPKICSLPMLSWVLADTHGFCSNLPEKVPLHAGVI